MEKTTLICSLSISLKEHVDAYATANGMSTSEFVRRCIAKGSGYDLDAENNGKVERRGRPRKYATDEERKEANRRRSAETYNLTKRLLEDHRSQQRRKDAQGIEDSLKRKGSL